MCFSAQASFITGAGLSCFGIYILQMPRKKTETAFLAIPLMFGIQQICEGFVWTTSISPELAFYNSIARYGFLFFAFFVWPLWIPYSLLQMETHPGRRRCLSSILGAGTAVSTSLAWISLVGGVTSAISCNHIAYALDLPAVMQIPGLSWYWIATLSPFFITKRKHMKEFGLLLFAFSLISLYFYSTWFTSVWCFFAALLSLMIYKIHIR